MASAEKWPARSWTIAAFTVVVVGGLALSAHRVLQTGRDLRRTTAVENAARYSEALQAFRSVYTSEVVHRAEELGIPATHNYQIETHSIPLPATMTKVLGERLGGPDGVQVRLYSDYPFPFRPPADLDLFQEKALSQLRANPEDTVVKFEGLEGAGVVRYAVADRLRPDCVACHNQHPDSPKRDWKLGDVRGVLEVAHPLSSAATALEGDLETTVAVLFLLGLVALCILALTAVRQRQIAAISQRMAQDAEVARGRIQEEMSARVAAETARQQAEAMTRHAQKMESLGLMAGGVAHDFNNLLVSILGNTQLAQAKMETSDPLSRHLSLVEKAGMKAADLTRKLLDYAGDSPSTPKPMDLNSCIDELSPLLSVATPGHAPLTLELEQGLPPILADHTQVEQVLINLVTNAAEAMESPGKPIIVRTGMADPETAVSFDAPIGNQLGDKAHIYLEVEDSGRGLDTETRERMFDPFFSTKGTGRGLGLATLLGIVNAHSGSVVVWSTLGEGTTFRIGFPLSPADIPDNVDPTEPESG